MVPQRHRVVVDHAPSGVLHEPHDRLVDRLCEPVLGRVIRHDRANLGVVEDPGVSLVAKEGPLEGLPVTARQQLARDEERLIVQLLGADADRPCDDGVYRDDR